MTCCKDDNILSKITEVLFADGLDGLEQVVAMLVNEAMRIERNKHLNVEAYERSEDRRGYANGFKDKTLKTRIGALDLKIPQTRDCDFYPSFLQKGIRSERALICTIAKMYIEGVSTRKVKKILDEMCGFNVSSSDVSRATKSLDGELNKWRNRPLGRYIYLSLDARYEKIRYDESVIDCAILTAIGIDESGRRSIIGVSEYGAVIGS
jgi:transposase-like protein